MENITPFDLGGLAKDLDNQLIGMRSPFGPAEDRPLHEASYVGGYFLRERGIGFCWSCEHLRGRSYVENSIKSVEVKEA